MQGARPLQVAYDELKSSGFTAPENVFFMKQKIGNACGTFALFHALANLEGVIDLGKSMAFWSPYVTIPTGVPGIPQRNFYSENVFPQCSMLF